MNRPITSTETEAVFKNLWKNRSLGPEDFTGEFYQTFKDLIPILCKLFQKSEEEGMVRNMLWGQNLCDTKTRQRKHKKGKLLANISDEYRCKNPQQNISNDKPTANITLNDEKWKLSL